MPTIQPQANASGASRQVNRPPWVKEGPPALPMPSSAPWMRSRELRASRDDGQTTAVSPELQAARDRLNAVEVTPATNKPEAAPIRRLSKITIVPATPAENGRQAVKREVNSKPSVEPEPVKPKPEPSKKSETPNAKSKQAAATKEKAQDGTTSKATGAREKRIPVETAKEKTEPPKEKPKATAVAPKEKAKTPVEPVKQKARSPPKEKPEPVAVAVKRERVQEAPKPPPAPPAPPAPPPPPPMSAAILPDYAPPTTAKLEKIEALKSRPRRRPDWGTMMKEIETARKLNHVVCNDRSSPLLATPIKVKEQFMYESEKPNVHNRLLDQIQSGVQLKSVKTNDRSRPILDGLRKFRRQMTIEEQGQKADAESVIAEQDELDDIDKVRDDLQSTKQMLALELRNKEAMERENKKLMARLLNLEVELAKERAAKQQDQNPQSQRLDEEKETRKLKEELTEVQKVAEDMETKFHETAGQLELTKGELEDMQRKNQILERRLANYASRDDGDRPIMKQMSAKKLAATKSNSKVNMAHQAAAAAQEEEESEYEEETETESEENSSEEEDKEALQEKRLLRELKMLNTKLKSFKDKEEMTRKERVSLREQLKKLTAMLKEEKKKYKVLQKEVDSMASVLKEDEDEEEEEEEESESESESESDSEASEEESDGDLPAEASSADKKQNLTVRAKRHETTLSVLKKGNYMLKANVDRIKDDLFKQKEMAITLQEDLNAVLAELG